MDTQVYSKISVSIFQIPQKKQLYTFPCISISEVNGMVRLCTTFKCHKSYAKVVRWCIVNLDFCFVYHWLSLALSMWRAGCSSFTITTFLSDVAGLDQHLLVNWCYLKMFIKHVQKVITNVCRHWRIIWRVEPQNISFSGSISLTIYEVVFNC